MSANNFAWRAGAFVRSVLPAEPAHWLILVSSTLLFLSANLRWWSGPLPSAAESFEWRIRAASFSRFFVIAGAAGYYLCFVPPKRRSFLPVFLTLAPAIVVLIAMTTLAVSWATGSSAYVSVIGQVAGFAWHTENFKTLVTGFDIGFWAPAIGLVLMAVVFVLRHMGRATLPVRLGDPSSRPLESETDVGEQRRTMRFVWIMIAVAVLASGLLGSSAFVLLELYGRRSWLMSTTPHGLAIEILNGATLSAPVLLALIPNVKSTLREGFRLPSLSYLGLSILIPMSLAALWPAALYGYERVHWAAFESQLIYPPPNASAFFAFPVLSQLGRFAPALVEEIGWRGFLQPRFIRRYGMARGIFFVGLVWGAFHFAGDIRGHMTAVVLILRILWRLCLTISQSYVLAWLTIRSRSVLPAALTHGSYNILLLMPIRVSIWTIPLLWAACAWVLFRYFPVEADDESVAAETGPTLEPAI
jgi:membrane protease YdiL (CAAX protease family)